MSAEEVDDTEYTHVVRRKARPNVLIPVAAFGSDKVTMTAKRALLAECIRGLALPLAQPMVQGLQIADRPTEPYFVFEVGAEAEVEALLTAGIQQGEDGGMCVYFQKMPDGQHEAEESRSIEIKKRRHRFRRDKVNGDRLSRFQVGCQNREDDDRHCHFNPRSSRL
ncbi:hypothetical protein EDD11_008297 [Mortierella claussenii]|nr:hypothetical protein EDD11_008297 [Mortierella claussenii]